MQRTDNYQIQLQQAKKRYLTYDQQDILQRTGIRYDEDYFYLRFLGSDYRICRKTGDMERKTKGSWQDGNSFNEVMTVLDWLCDSRADRRIAGRWVNLITQSHSFHTTLQEESRDPDAEFFDRNREGFSAACEALNGRPHPSADKAYVIDLLDGLEILVQLWYSDEEFPPRLRFLWDENTTQYIRYETTWYALGLLIRRLRENLPFATSRLILRPWQESDAESLYEYAKDPEVGYPAGWPAHTSPENSRDLIRSVLSAPETYAVCLKNNKAIGSIGLKLKGYTDMTDRRDECELGYWIGKPFWGQGMIPEAAAELLRHAFEDLGMRAVWCGYYEGNEKSRRVQQKLGFVYQYTTCDLEVSLLQEKRTGHTSLLTKEQWQKERKHG